MPLLTGPYSVPPTGMPEPFVITTLSQNCAGSALTVFSLSSQAYPAANLALFFPFVLTSTRTYKQALIANGATASGNFDIGIYDASGNRKGNLGSTVQAGVSTAQLATFGTAITIGPGTYYLALAASATTLTFVASGASQADIEMVGAYQMATAFPLPVTATFAVIGQGFVPVFGVSEFAAGVL